MSWKLAGGVGLGLAVVAMAASPQLHPAPPKPLPKIAAPPHLPRPDATRDDADQALVKAVEAARPFLVERRGLDGALSAGVQEPGPLSPRVVGYVRAHRQALKHLAAVRKLEAWVPDVNVSYMGLETSCACALAMARVALELDQPAAAVASWLDALGAGYSLAQAPHATADTLHEGDATVRYVLEGIAVEQPALMKLPTPALEALVAGLNQLEARRQPAHNLLWGQRDEALARLGKPEEWEEAFLNWGLDMVPFGRTLAAPRLLATRPLAEYVFDRRMAMLDANDLAALQADEHAPDVEPGDYQRMLRPEAYFQRLALQEVLPDTWDLYHYSFTTRMAVDGLRGGVAAELYRRANGHEPPDLAALAPHWLPAAPRDAYGTTLRYAKGRIWSVGPDGKDQGGKADVAWFADQPPEDLRFFPAFVAPPPKELPLTPPPPPAGNTTLRQIFGIDP